MQRRGLSRTVMPEGNRGMAYLLLKAAVTASRFARTNRRMTKAQRGRMKRMVVSESGDCVNAGMPAFVMESSP